MTFRRQIDFNSAMRDLRNDRAAPVPGFLAARAVEKARAEAARRELLSRPLVVGSSYDRSAIMRAAICEARMMRSRGDARAWHELMASALRFVWARAKAARPSL